MRFRIAIAWVLAASAVPAQRTWTFHAAGGAQFTDLQVAVDSVGIGDTILVRSGFGVATVAITRSVQLVGDAPGLTVVGLDVQGPAALSVTNLTVPEVELRSCRATFEGVQMRELRCDGSVALLQDSTIDGRSGTSGGTSLTNGSRVAFSRCHLFGFPGAMVQTTTCLLAAPRPALLVEANSTAQLASSNLTGAGPAVLYGSISVGTVAVAVAQTARVALSQCVLTSGIPLASGVAQSVSGSGLVASDGSTFLPAFAGAVPVLLPRTSGAGAAPGGVMSWQLEGVPGWPAVAVASVGARTPTPTPEGLVWIDLNAMAVLAIGFLDGQGRMTSGVPIPLGILRGVPLTVQGAALPAASSTLIAAVPATLHVL